MKFMIFLLATFSVILSNFGKPTQEPLPPHVVTHITIESPDSPSQLYSSPDKMRKVLNYLRVLETFPPEAQPPAADPERYRITLHHPDGSTVVYQQSGNGYFRSEEESWQAIDPEQCGKLHALLHAVPPDGHL